MSWHLSQELWVGIWRSCRVAYINDVTGGAGLGTHNNCKLKFEKLQLAIIATSQTTKIARKIAFSKRLFTPMFQGLQIYVDLQGEQQKIAKDCKKLHSLALFSCVYMGF